MACAVIEIPEFTESALNPRLCFPFSGNPVDLGTLAMLGSRGRQQQQQRVSAQHVCAPEASGRTTYERWAMLRKLQGFRKLALSAALACAAVQVQAQDAGPQPEYPPFAKVLEGFEKVVTKANINPMYTLYTRAKDGQMYAELPRDFQMRKYFIATTVASGEEYAGLQAGDLYVYWRRYDRHLALIAPNIEYRAQGDREAESSVKRLFTDRVLMEVPIVTMGPNGGPVIDMDSMLLDRKSTRLNSSH